MPMGDSILEKLRAIFGAEKVLTRDSLILRATYSVTLLAEAHRNEKNHDGQDGFYSVYHDTSLLNDA